MKLLNKTTFLIGLGLVFQTMTISAQTLTDRVYEDPTTSANIYHVYKQREGKLTPAPKGYQPFYISHYGRHGSRYLTGDYYFRPAMAMLEAEKEKGNLTEVGENLYSDIKKLAAAHEGMYGELSPRGAREHRAISGRMYNRFTKVFKSKTRNKVNCISSVVPRCIISMANFTTALNDNRPELEFSYTTGDKYFELLAHNYDTDEIYKTIGHITDSLRKATCHYDKFYGKIFKNPTMAVDSMKSPYSLIGSVYSSACICECLDFLNVDLFKYFDKDELAQQAVVRNNRVYGDLGNSIECGDVVAASARFLLQDFVDKADAALQNGSDVAADLRFGHDSGIQPFFCILGIEGHDKQLHIADADKSWFSDLTVCMGTNLQMIFYKNKKGQVLVKLLYNEAEAMIPAVQAYSGPYYRWEDLRSYFVDRIAAAKAFAATLPPPQPREE